MATQVLITPEQFFALPEKPGIDTELLRGRLIEMSRPTVVHGVIQANFCALLHTYLRQSAASFVVGSNAGFQLSEETVLGPDVFLISKEKLRSMRIVRGASLGAPDLDVEIASPSESAVDLEEKVAEYLAAGTQIVWVAYAKTRHVVTYHCNGEGRRVGVGEILEAPDLLPGLGIPVGELFSDR